MAMTVHCDIVSAEEEIFSGLVEVVSATGTSGELGIYPGHSPLLTKLVPGPVRITLAGGEQQIFYASGGFLEVQSRTVSILADTAVRADDVDEAAALEAQKLAEQELAQKSSDVNYTKAAAQLAEAAAQLRTVQEIRKKMR